MFSRKRSFAILSLALLLVGALSSCSVVSKIVPSKKVETNLLSGREGSNGPVLAVKIDDTNQAHPQIGLEDADVVYIEQVEGGLTRLAAIFSSKVPNLIGPVRSARISDLDILAQYGRVGFAYSGAQRKFLPEIAAANLVDVGANTQGPIIYTNDPNRIRPYAMILQADLLMQRIKEKNYPIDTAKDVGFRFGPLQDGGAATTDVEINWPAATYSATWSDIDKRWLLTHNSNPNLAQSGLHLGPTTLIIQMVTISDSIYKDKLGGVTPFSQTVGSGKAYILRDGLRFVATWNRAFETSGTTFTLADGEVMNFAPGQIWVALTDREPVFTSPPEPATK